MQNNSASAMTQDQSPRSGIDSCETEFLPVRTGKFRPTAFSKGHYPGVTIPNDTLPGLKSIGFWDCAGPQNWGLDTHRNEGVEIHFVETGNLVFVADGRRFDLHPGDFSITKPWQPHKLGDPNIGPGRVHWLIIDVGVRRPDDPWRWPGIIKCQCANPLLKSRGSFSK